MMNQTTIRNRTQRRLFTFSLLVGVILLLSLLTAPVAAAKLATPMLISPANNQHIMNFDNNAFLAWKPVKGANYYTVDLELKTGGGGWTPYTA